MRRYPSNSPEDRRRRKRLFRDKQPSDASGGLALGGSPAGGAPPGRSRSDSPLHGYDRGGRPRNEPIRNTPARRPSEGKAPAAISPRERAYPKSPDTLGSPLSKPQSRPRLNTQKQKTEPVTKEDEQWKGARACELQSGPVREGKVIDVAIGFAEFFDMYRRGEAEPSNFATVHPYVPQPLVEVGTWLKARLLHSGVSCLFHPSEAAPCRFWYSETPSLPLRP